MEPDTGLLPKLKKDHDDSQKSMSNPFETAQVTSYNHKPNIVPIYVLDTLSQAHYKDQLGNSNVNVQQSDINAKARKAHDIDTNDNKQNKDNNNSSQRESRKSLTSQATKRDEDEYVSFANDPFIKSMDNSWNRFLNTIKQPNTYSNDIISFDKDTVFENKLEGTWGGEERLKSALLGSPSSDNDTYVNDNGVGCFGGFKRLFGFHRPSRTANDSPKVRSNAGYWMSDEKRADLLPLLKRIFVINPLVPLLLRIMIIFFSACALGLAGTIFQHSNHRYEGSRVEQQPSTIMAIVVQCFAIVYVAYIAYDEYSGKPLGLRDPLGKMKLIMLDLLFIIFSSANLSLTFNTLYDDEWVCKSNPEEDYYIQNDPGSRRFFTPTVASICRRQRGLAAFLFLVLNLWVLTFTISIVRVVDRVSVKGQRPDLG